MTQANGKSAPKHAAMPSRYFRTCFQEGGHISGEGRDTRNGLVIRLYGHYARGARFFIA